MPGLLRGKIALVGVSCYCSLSTKLVLCTNYKPNQYVLRSKGKLDFSDYHDLETIYDFLYETEQQHPSVP